MYFVSIFKYHLTALYLYLSTENTSFTENYVLKPVILLFTFHLNPPINEHGWLIYLFAWLLFRFIVGVCL